MSIDHEGAGPGAEHLPDSESLTADELRKYDAAVYAAMLHPKIATPGPTEAAHLWRTSYAMDSGEVVIEAPEPGYNYENSEEPSDWATRVTVITDQGQDGRGHTYEKQQIYTHELIDGGTYYMEDVTEYDPAGVVIANHIGVRESDDTFTHGDYEKVKNLLSELRPEDEKV